MVIDDFEIGYVDDGTIVNDDGAVVSDHFDIGYVDDGAMVSDDFEIGYDDGAIDDLEVGYVDDGAMMIDDFENCTMMVTDGFAMVNVNASSTSNATSTRCCLTTHHQNRVRVFASFSVSFPRVCDAFSHACALSSPLHESFFPFCACPRAQESKTNLSLTSEEFSSLEHKIRVERNGLNPQARLLCYRYSSRVASHFL